MYTFNISTFETYGKPKKCIQNFTSRSVSLSLDEALGIAEARFRKIFGLKTYPPPPRLAPADISSAGLEFILLVSLDTAVAGAFGKFVIPVIKDLPRRSKRTSLKLKRR